MPLFRELLFNVSKFASKELYRQYMISERGKLSPCSGHFTATMGLPCAHKIKSLQGTSISLEHVHQHWRIDTLSLTSKDISQNNDSERLDNLVNVLHSKYKVWPEHKKEYATLILTKILNDHDILFDPMIQRPKGRPPNSKRKKENNFYVTRTFQI